MKRNKVERLFSAITDIYLRVLEDKAEKHSIADRMMLLEAEYPDSQVLKGIAHLGFYTFNADEQSAFLLLVSKHYEYGLQPVNFSSLLNSQYFDKGKEGLLERGIARYVAPEDGEKVANRAERIMLSADVCGEVFYGITKVISYEKMARQVEVIKPDSIRKKELYFEDENQEDIVRLKKLLDPKRYKEIIDRLKVNGRRASISSLFYGAPGTGKTELAKQLAKMTGRDIMIADVSKLHSSFTGDTEKNYREMFAGYRYIAKIMPKAPILLLNEADGILGKRGDVMRQAIDKIANRVQNLLLQELEDFEGIMIATTNLADNLDPAFERRLLFKIKFLKPGVEVRRKIWKAMMPNVDKETVGLLAANYEFSGGQIENIATKMDIDYVIDGEWPSRDRIVSYCDSEKIHETVQIRKIGFAHSLPVCSQHEKI